MGSRPSVRPRPDNNNIEIRVWPTEAREHVELSFPLNNSGTGVSQVIALLTAIMTIENAVIIVDEINSFLHPAAVKALLRILQTQYSQHQYIISTHAPEVVGFSNPRTIHLVKRSGYESTVTPLVLEHVNQFREIAEHLGVSMADVFAAEQLIWVEGPTEELCFPLLYAHATGAPLPRGTIFTSVVATGDFIAKKRDRELIYQIYRRLSSATALLVQSVQFSFDREELNAQEIEDTIRHSKGAVHFLPRRHIECFLINAEALAIFIKARDLGTGSRSAPMQSRHLSELAAKTLTASTSGEEI
jgi:energy-coupling factor transporter ATP-binding protein EcfA2